MPSTKLEGHVGVGQCAYCHADSNDLSRVTYEVQTYLCPSCAERVIMRSDPDLLRLVTRNH